MGGGGVRREEEEEEEEDSGVGVVLRSHGDKHARAARERRRATAFNDRKAGAARYTYSAPPLDVLRGTLLVLLHASV